MPRTRFPEQTRSLWQLHAEKFRSDTAPHRAVHFQNQNSWDDWSLPLTELGVGRGWGGTSMAAAGILLTERVVRKKGRVLVWLLWVAIFSSGGCATMSDEDTTKAQGTTVGAIGGAILGGGLGVLAALASGGSSEQILAGALIGGVAGGIMGGTVGYQYGMAVAQRKAYYRDAEDFYLSEIAQIELNTQAMQSANQQLTREVAALENRKAQLDRALADGQIDQRAYQVELGALRRQAKGIQRNMRPAEEMIGYQRALLEDARQSGASPQVAQELQRAAAEQEATYETTEKALQRLAEITQPTRG